MIRPLIAIPTFRRPAMLRHLLDALAREPTHGDVRILVADNDAGAQAGYALVQAMIAAGYPLPLEAMLVPEPGLCSVRNAIVAAALADPDITHLAMIDDDEWPQPGWLASLLDVQRRTGADAVAGPVDPHFTAASPRWAGQALVFRPEVRPEGETAMLWASNNLLLTRAALERLPRPWFDPQFNRSGGEDLDFLTRLQRQGARFAWAPAARVSEWVPPERVALRWIWRRMWRIGVTETMARHKWASGAAARAWLVMRSLGIALLRTVMLTGLLLPGINRVDLIGQWVKAGGRLHALAGGRDSLYQAPVQRPSGRSIDTERLYDHVA